MTLTATRKSISRAPVVKNHIHRVVHHEIDKHHKNGDFSKHGRDRKANAALAGLIFRNYKTRLISAEAVSPRHSMTYSEADPQILASNTMLLRSSSAWTNPTSGTKYALSPVKVFSFHVCPSPSQYILLGISSACS